MSNILWKKLHLCFSSTRLIQPSSPPSILSLPTQPDNHRRPSHTTSSFFINNFNFLYDHLSSPRHHNPMTNTVTGGSESQIAGFATVFAQRRFQSPPEVSGLISSGLAETKKVDSLDPYRDFRKSMEEMVEAMGVKADREFLHELLFCYLSLNPKHIHKYIISAFADTLVSLLSEDSSRSSD